MDLGLVVVDLGLVLDCSSGDNSNLVVVDLDLVVLIQVYWWWIWDSGGEQFSPNL